MKRADSLLAPFIRTLGIEDAVKLERIKKEWAGVFERPIPLHMSPAKLKDGELLINVDSPVWMQQLNFFKEDITKKLHCFGIKTVRFKLGRVLPWGKQEIISKGQSLTANDHSYIEETVSSISDQELRERIKKAIEKSITFKRQR